MFLFFFFFLINFILLSLFFVSKGLGQASCLPIEISVLYNGFHFGFIGAFWDGMVDRDGSSFPLAVVEFGNSTLSLVLALELHKGKSTI